MRRKDRQIDKEFALQIIDQASYGTLSMVDLENKAYAIPLSLVREGDYLYFHSAKEGKKTEIFKEKSQVWLSFVGKVQVPENYSHEQLEEMVKDKSNIKELISNVFTTEFESTLVKGKLERVENKDEQVRAMELICQKYTPDKMAYFPLAIEAGLSRVHVYKVKIEEISGKRKKYDSKGQEMKWGRMT